MLRHSLVASLLTEPYIAVLRVRQAGAMWPLKSGYKAYSADWV